MSNERRPDTRSLDTLNGKQKELDPEYGWKLYQKGLDYDRTLNLFDTVKVNENFFIGKQWEGVVSNGLPTPVFNVLKRTCSFIVASITSDNLKVSATPLAATANTKALIEPARIVNEELDALTERNRIPALVGEYARNAAVDGDGCLYTYWDDEEETGQDAKGGIKGAAHPQARKLLSQRRPHAAGLREAHGRQGGPVPPLLERQGDEGDLVL